MHYLILKILNKQLINYNFYKNFISYKSDFDHNLTVKRFKLKIYSFKYAG